MRRGRNHVGGFSLLELFLVLAVLSLLLAFAAPGFIPVMQARSLTAGADEFEQALGLARQTAMTEDVVVDVEFLSPAESPGEFSGYRFWKWLPGGERRGLGKIRWTKGSFSFSTEFSTILREGGAESTTGTLPGVLVGPVAIVRFSIFPDGSTDLPGREDSDTWHVTLADFAGGRRSLPKNFIVFQVNQTNSQVQRFRP